MKRALLIASVLALLLGTMATTTAAAQLEPAQTTAVSTQAGSPSGALTETLSCEDLCSADLTTCRQACPRKMPYWEYCVDGCLDDYEACLAGC